MKNSKRTAGRRLAPVTLLATPDGAVTRALEMARIPMGMLPPLALKYAHELGRKYGLCGEVYLTAFAHYAQAVEKLKCSDSLYRIGKEGRAFFAANNKVERPR